MTHNAMVVTGGVSGDLYEEKMLQLYMEKPLCHLVCHLVCHPVCPIDSLSHFCPENTHQVFVSFQYCVVVVTVLKRITATVRPRWTSPQKTASLLTSESQTGSRLLVATIYLSNFSFISITTLNYKKTHICQRCNLYRHASFGIRGASVQDCLREKGYCLKPERWQGPPHKKK